MRNEKALAKQTVSQGFFTDKETRALERKQKHQLKKIRPLQTEVLCPPEPPGTCRRRRCVRASGTEGWASGGSQPRSPARLGAVPQGPRCPGFQRRRVAVGRFSRNQDGRDSSQRPKLCSDTLLRLPSLTPSIPGRSLRATSPCFTATQNDGVHLSLRLSHEQATAWQKELHRLIHQPSQHLGGRGHILGSPSALAYSESLSEDR